jgi:hypothetical protein
VRRMIAYDWRWKAHRLRVDRGWARRPFSSSTRLRVLALTERDSISQSQVYPFYCYWRWGGIEFRERPVAAFDCDPGGADIVLLQTWFDLTPDGLSDLIERVRSRSPRAAIVYLDWFAPVDLRYAEALADRVAVYVKKQLFSDFTKYGAATLGDTNLTDYCARRFGLAMPAYQFGIPRNFQKRLMLGPGFECDPQIIALAKKSPNFVERPIDVQARIGTSGTDWYTELRKEAKTTAAKLRPAFSVAMDGSVPRRQFVAELRQSKMCLSPFGYGEVCWRDFEAMACGALVLKPDMSHVRLATDFFRPNETYVPLRWDFADLEEKVAHFARHTDERIALATRAYRVLRESQMDAAMSASVKAILNKAVEMTEQKA